MFAYILHVRTPASEEADQFFRRFTQTPGLLHAFDLQASDDPDDATVVAIWEDREAAERYLNSAPLRKEVDEAFPKVTRTMYEVRASK
jgi:heme-degrading monooxygenase HmoA